MRSDKHKTLVIPGPVEVRPEILDAQTEWMIGHRSTAFADLFARLQDKLKQTFLTQNRVFLLGSSGSMKRTRSRRSSRANPRPVSAAVISAFSPTGLPVRGKFVSHIPKTSSRIVRSRCIVPPEAPRSSATPLSPSGIGSAAGAGAASGAGAVWEAGEPGANAGTGAEVRTPGGPSRWNAGKDLAWIAVRPERVVEVAFDRMQGDRFRHATRLVRWRPDRTPASCTFAQLGTREGPPLAELWAAPTAGHVARRSHR